MEKSDAFDALNELDQKAAIDVAVGLVVIGLRITTIDKALYDFIATEFSSSRGLPSNPVKYALRSLGRRLYEQDWTMTIEKTGKGVTTHFAPVEPGGNSEVNRT